MTNTNKGQSEISITYPQESTECMRETTLEILRIKNKQFATVHVNYNLWKIQVFGDVMPKIYQEFVGYVQISFWV